ncbi:MAG: ARPP-1 family domain-containing protein [Armatimonadota bacterium]
MHTQIAEALLHLQLGEPVTFKNLSMFPLLNGVTGSLDYLTLEEALQASLVMVSEVHEGGVVNNLKVTNRASQAVLIVDGEELVGAKQNRVVNLTILVPAKQTVVIPVTCVEQGRWHHVSRNFRTSRQAMPSTMRALKAGQVYYRRMTTGEAYADQAALWDAIAARLMEMDVHSPTAAMADIYDRFDVTLHDYEQAFKPLDGQVGALFAINGRIVSLDVFDAASTFARFFPKLLRGCALDAISYFQPQFTPLTMSAVRDFIHRVAHADAQAFPAVGEGEDVRFRAAGVVGAALVARDRMIHLCAFTSPDAPDEREDNPFELFTSLSRPSARWRRHWR